MLNRLRLVTFDLVGSQTRKIGIHVDKHIVDLTKADSSIPNDARSFLAGGAGLFTKTQKIVESGLHRIPEQSVKIRAPIYNPEKVVCVGLNYRDHAKESNMPIPPEPILFSKFPNAIIGTGENIVKPRQVTELDYEVELVLVIGKTGRNIPKQDALKYIGGYTVGNDVSARDWQLRKPGGQWMVGKTWDTFAPIGPSILLNPLLLSPTDSFNPNNLGVRCILNGNTVQSSNTREFIFDVASMIEYISQLVTLQPGDLIFTGTPHGVGMGRKPQLWMKAGDRVRCEIDELGAIENPVVDAAAL
eukprot:Phypoly_transcript_11309.p1 GENE.Phypoly_transcript_11309~~Phypoly_transcript_11309.p1  ORF type:complete len:302 (+),score=45.29 Phypoly_transcript_11309:47-952(+)